MFLIAVGISPQLLYLLNLHINFLTVAPGGEDSQMSVKIWGYVQGSKSQSCKSRYIVTLKGNKVLKNFRECFLKTMKLRSQLKTRTLWVSRSAIDFWGSFGSLAMHRSHLCGCKGDSVPAAVHEHLMSKQSIIQQVWATAERSHLAQMLDNM